MTVKIVFADGSKQMSHNTEDLRERWELRKEVECITVRQESAVGFEIPLLEAANSFDEVCVARRVYVQMDKAIQVRFALLRPANKYAREREHLAFVQADVTQELHKANTRIKNHRQDRADRDEHRAFVQLQKYAHQLEECVLACGAELPDSPFEWWNPSEPSLPIAEHPEWNKSS